MTLTTEEKIVDICIRYIWIFYFTGLLYVVGSAAGWLLFVLLAWRFVQGHSVNIHWSAYIWAAGMLIQLLAIVIAHINLDLPVSSLIKSSIGWAKGWGLLGIFPLLAALDVRAFVISRAMMSLAKITLCIIPILIVAAFIKLPSSLYVSPLSFLANVSFFEIELYGLNASTGFPRWRLFTPWGPALGLYGNLLLAFSLSQKNMPNRHYGLIAAVAMIVLSQSRMGMICFLFIPCFCWFLIKLKSFKYLLALSITLPILAALVPFLFELSQDILQEIYAARADSSRVRGALERIALERWINEAPIWGHGVVENGSHYVEYMPIGSHHTWLGLLFVKGLVGFFALAVPLSITILLLAYRYLTAKPSTNHIRQYKTALHLILVLSAYSFTENLEILAYLHWPALLYIGLALNYKSIKA